jgi:hypothetical protein
LNLVGTGENGVAVAARVALSFAYAGIVEDMALVYDTDLDESYDDDDPRRLYPFVKKLCPDCYEEAIALFEQDMA